MAVFRKINTSFWQDPLILDLSPDEKYFYLYLMTNTKTNQCGIYEIPKKVMEMETGYNSETVDRLINKFVENKRILFSKETNEIMLINWIKYNGSSSPKVLSRIETELKEIKNKEMVGYYIKLSNALNYTLDTVSILYPYSIDTQSQEEEEEEEEVLEEEQEAKISSSNLKKPVDNFKKEDLAKVVKTFEENGFGQLSQIVKEKLLALIDEYDITWINEAFKISVENNKRTIKYVEGILRNWRVGGGMKLESDKKNPHKTTAKKTRFHNFENRTDKYTPDEINKKVEAIAERKKKEMKERREQEE